MDENQIKYLLKESKNKVLTGWSGSGDLWSRIEKKSGKSFNILFSRQLKLLFSAAGLMLLLLMSFHYVYVKKSRAEKVAASTLFQELTLIRNASDDYWLNLNQDSLNDAAVSFTAGSGENILLVEAFSDYLESKFNFFENLNW